ncbi:ADP-sugar_diphosphatase [Hexamita inflata]|uniref:ADP-sugar diphosphatase n=1 Tax=Hexamita inflata TaxID=28002 RepID=A0AA86NE91_9EUKA|nr:ADP-sugar diphosphatase [Hexamita inflata]
MNININGDTVQATFAQGLDQEKLIPLLKNFRPLNDWINNFDKNIKVSAIEIQSVDLFGPRIGFLKIKSILTDILLNKNMPGIIFFRGDAVAVLPIINNAYVLLTEQFRAPVGRKLLEIPAGMTDGEGNFSGVAIKELEEECGIKVKMNDLKDLGRMIPSAGGCDENLHLFLLPLTMSQLEIEEMKQKLFGTEHEAIRIKFLTVEEAWQLEDAKTLVALGKWARMQ